MPAFWDGGKRLVIRFTPIEAGEWDYRLTSNLKSLEGKIAKFSATELTSPGFVRSANGHHWANTETNKQHLWMGDTNLRFASMDRALFEQFVTTRAKQKFNHLRGLILGGPEDVAKAFPTPDQPSPAWFQEVDQRVLFLNKSGITSI